MVKQGLELLEKDKLAEKLGTVRADPKGPEALMPDPMAATVARAAAASADRVSVTAHTTGGSGTRWSA
jgi:hypothetical protein